MATPFSAEYKRGLEGLLGEIDSRLRNVSSVGPYVISLRGAREAGLQFALLLAEAEAREGNPGLLKVREWLVKN